MIALLIGMVILAPVAIYTALSLPAMYSKQIIVLLIQSVLSITVAGYILVNLLIR